MLVTLTACIMIGAMVPTVRMENVWLAGEALTALLFFIIKRIAPASTLTAETLIITLLLRLLVSIPTVDYLPNVFERSYPVTALIIANRTTKICFAIAKHAR